MFRGPLLVLLVPTVLFGCNALQIQPDKGARPLERPRFDVPSPLLLDVRIQVFDPCDARISEGASPDSSAAIRNLESTYVAVQLKKSLDRAGQWGAVRVVPATHSGDEVIVTGSIIESTGDELALKVRAYDATGKKWFSKTLASVVTGDLAVAAAEQEYDVFVNIYNTIANQLAAYRMNLSADQIQEIRCVAETRFAEQLLPRDFEEFLSRGSDGFPKGPSLTLVSVPPEDSQSLRRVRRVRTVDHKIIDGFDAHYVRVHEEMKQAYANWRTARIQHTESLRAPKISTPDIATDETGKADDDGGAAVASAPAEPYPGATALANLGTCVAFELEPVRHGVDGRTIELTGAAPDQDRQWQDFLTTLYQVENESEVLPEEPRRKG